MARHLSVMLMFRVLIIMLIYACAYCPGGSHEALVRVNSVGVAVHSHVDCTFCSSQQRHTMCD